MSDQKKKLPPEVEAEFDAAAARLSGPGYFVRQPVDDPAAPGGEVYAGVVMPPGRRMATDEEFRARIKREMASR